MSIDMQEIVVMNTEKYKPILHVFNIEKFFFYYAIVINRNKVQNHC